MQQRRSTLGALSPAQINSRVSLGPARLAKDAKTARKGNNGNVVSSRLSMATGLQRRSSTYSKRPSGTKQDPRPISDKGYQQNCARLLIQYLSTHGYEHPVSPKTLNSPMSKDVFNIVQFLLRQVDPHVRSLGKPEDDVPALFKQLRYPFQISKSALFAVGSPHTWPGLLAALAWIVELLNYQEKAEQARADGFDDRVHSEGDFFEYIASSYKFFLAGDDAQAQAVDDAQAAAFEERAAEVRLRNAALEEENQKLQAELDGLHGQPSALAAAEAKKAEHASDRHKFQSLIENLQTHKQSLQRKLQERQADLQSKLQQLAVVEQENEAMHVTIAAQTVSKEDVARMNHEKTKQTDILASVGGQREALEARACEQEVALEQQLDELEAGIQAYHAAADRLQLIPLTAKRAGGVVYELHLDRAGSGPNELVGCDLKGTIKPALARLRDSLTERARELGEELLALQERCDAASEALTERTEENATLETQIHRLEAMLRSSREALEAELRDAEAQAGQLKGEVGTLRSAAGHTLAGSEQGVARLREQRESVRRACETESHRLHVDMGAALEALFHHKLHVQETLDKVQAHVNGVVAEIAALPLVAHSIDEVEAFQKVSAGLLVNVGTLSPDWVTSMRLSAQTATAAGHPWVLDPVGCGATAVRTQVVGSLVELKPTVVRGNASEILAAAGAAGAKTKGVESTAKPDDALDAGKQLARQTGGIVAISGSTDLVTDGSCVVRVGNGTQLMTKITAAGCAVTAVVAAFVVAAPDQPLLATAFALGIFGVAAELAAVEARGPGSLRTGMLDYLHNMEMQQLVQYLDVVEG